MVRDIEHVCARFADRERDAREFARLIDHVHANSHDASRTHAMAHDDGREDAEIDIPAAQDRAHALPGESFRVGEQRRDARCTCALDHELLIFQEMRDARFDRSFRNGHDVAYARPNVLEGDDAGCLHRDALGDGRRADHGSLTVQRGSHARIRCGLHADDFRARSRRRDRQRGSRNEPAAADRHEQHVDLAIRIFEQLERRRALARDHVLIIVGMHDRTARLRCKRACVRGRIVERFPGEHDRRAEIARAAHLEKRRRGGHDDRRAQADTRPVIRYRLAVVSGRHRDDAAGALFGCEHQHGVERTALLIRSGGLTILHLQKHLGPRGLGERTRAHGGRPPDGGADALGGRAHRGAGS